MLGVLAPSPCLPVSLAELEEYLLATKGQAVAGKDRKHSKTGSGGSRGVPKVRTLRVPFIKVEDRSRCVCLCDLMMKLV